MPETAAPIVACTRWRSWSRTWASDCFHDHVFYSRLRAARWTRLRCLLLTLQRVSRPFAQSKMPEECGGGAYDDGPGSSPPAHSTAVVAASTASTGTAQAGMVGPAADVPSSMSGSTRSTRPLSPDTMRTTLDAHDQDDSASASASAGPSVSYYATGPHVTSELPEPPVASAVLMLPSSVDSSHNSSQECCTSQPVLMTQCVDVPVLDLLSMD